MKGPAVALLALLLIAGGCFVAINHDGEVGVLAGAALFAAGMVFMRQAFARGAR